MGDASYTRADRRRREKIDEAVGRITEGDARFFERRPDREYRVRLAALVELEQNTALEGAEFILTRPGYRWYAVVRQIVPGVRMRVFAQGEADQDTDVPEEFARALYSQIVCPGSELAILERNVAAAIAKREERRS